MTGISERNRQKNELTSVGFSMKYIDEWHPRITLYRHKPSYNNDGEMTADIGTSVEGVTGEPSYVLKKAKIGLFPWKPNEGCTCQWCNKNKVLQDAAKAEVAKAAPEASAPGAPIVRGNRRLGPYYKSQV